MDDPHHHGDPEYDPNYGLPALSPSSTLARFSATPAISNHDSDPTFSYGLPTLETIAPSSLNAFHTSHDDSCIDTCIAKDYNPQPPHRGLYTPSHGHRPRLSTSSMVRPQYQLENNAFTAPIPDFDFFSQYFFPEMKFNMDTNVKPPPLLPYSGHQVSGSAPLDPTSAPGLIQQCAVADDCVSVDCSQVSCSSNCCSRVCQDNDCTEGTPCNDVACFDDDIQPSLDHIFDFPDRHSPMGHGQGTDEAHNQPCNHTNAEHDVAFTLRDLKEPASSNLPHHHPGVYQFECPFLDPTDQTAVENDRTFSLGHEHLGSLYDTTIDLDSSGSKTHIDVPSKAPEAAQHVCSWVVSDKESGEEKVCGHVFNDSVSLNDHLCAEHISRLSAKTKYVCHWKGCSRGDDQGFASRNKLKRHITTHTACT